MDDFFLANKQFYLDEVAKFNTKSSKASPASSSTTKPSDPNEDVLDTTISVRVRPLLPHELEAGHVPGAYIARDDFGGVVNLHELRKKVVGKPALTTSTFQFDKVYGPEDSSPSLYADLFKPLVPWVWSGGVGIFTAYGQTGSGKTFTTTALQELVAKDLFEGMEGKRTIRISVFELAGAATNDLLNNSHPISILEDSFGQTQLVGALEVACPTESTLLEQIQKGASLRSTATTAKNEQSSRSHAICRIRLTNDEIPEMPDGILFLVDLAGSEAGADSKAHSAERMKETKEINTSLSILKDCIRARAQYSLSLSATSTKRAPKIHIPFRNARLTKVLKAVFDVSGNQACKTVFVGCVSPSVADTGMGRNTLRYAELLKVPVPKGTKGKELDGVPSTWGNSKAREWIAINSGDPPIDPATLIPKESGAQLLRMPVGEFVERCMKTPGVDYRQAKAFFDKLWRTHIDSRNITSSAKTEVVVEAPPAPKTPFQERLKTGMFIRRQRADEKADPIEFALILSPVGAFEKSGVLAETPVDKRKYIVADVQPSPMTDAYTIDLAYTRLIGVEDMEKEVFMEWDNATRYYYMLV